MTPTDDRPEDATWSLQEENSSLALLVGQNNLLCAKSTLQQGGVCAWIAITHCTTDLETTLKFAKKY